MRGFWSIFVATLFILFLTLIPIFSPILPPTPPLDFYNRLANAARACMFGSCPNESGTLCFRLVAVQTPWGGDYLPSPEVGKICWK